MAGIAWFVMNGMSSDKSGKGMGIQIIKKMYSIIGKKEKKQIQKTMKNKNIFLLVLISILLYSFKPQDDIFYEKLIFSEKIQTTIYQNTSNDKLKELVLNILKNTGDPVDPIVKSDVESIKYWGNLKVNDHKTIEIFKIKLSYRLPAVQDYFNVLIVDNEFLKVYFIPLNTIEPLKIKKNDENYFLAGRYKRKYGTFLIFNFEDQTLKIIFTSPDYVSNFSLDCISYQNDDLKFNNVDLNNDGFLDLKFYGIKNYYCEGGENYGRNEKKPIRREKISIDYFYDIEKQTWKSSP